MLDLGLRKATADRLAAKGAVTRQELRPNDYWLIWPDLPAPAEKAEV